MNIMIPSDSEKAKSIEEILGKGLTGNVKVQHEINRMVSSIGIKNAFLGVGDAVALSILLGVISFSIQLLLLTNEVNTSWHNHIYVVMFFSSPIIYFAMYFFIYLKEKIVNTYELLMTCRYNINHITAIRLIIISGVSLIFVLVGSIIISVFTHHADFSFLTVFGVSLSSILLYGILTLLALILPNRRFYQTAVPIFWVLCGTVLFTIMNTYNFKITIAPDSIFILLLAAVLLAVYIIEFRIFIKKSTKGALSHALGK